MEVASRSTDLSVHLRQYLEGARATGVLTGDGQVLAGDQIVLAAGSYASPAPLMRSGIGDPADMSRMGSMLTLSSLGSAPS